MKITKLTLAAICALSASVVMADKMAADTTPAEDLKLYRDYFSKRFPGIPLNEYGNGVYAIDKVSRDSWEAIEDFPPYEPMIEAVPIAEPVRTAPEPSQPSVRVASNPAPTRRGPV